MTGQPARGLPGGGHRALGAQGERLAHRVLAALEPAGDARDGQGERDHRERGRPATLREQGQAPDRGPGRGHQRRDGAGVPPGERGRAEVP